MKQYLELLNTIMTYGEDREDRTGTGTKSIFGYTFRHNMADGFPLLTTKKVPLRWVFEELKWFLSGSTNVKDLQAKGVDIWDEWATEEQCARFNRQAGDLGPVYGALWRSYPVSSFPTIDKRYYYSRNIEAVDQIEALIESIKNNPKSRRHIVTGWHPYWATQVALPPCHTLFQCYVHTNKKLSLQLYARSIDSFLGLPFNIASYGMLLLMLCNVCSLDPGELIITFGDLHIYNNHMEQVVLQLSRLPRKLPTVTIEGEYKDINNIEWGSVNLSGYNPHPHIKAPVAI